MSASGSDERWTVARLLQATQGFFASRGIESARLDAELLLCQVLGRDRIYLYTHYDQPVTPAERDALRALVRRRGAHAPVAYLRGEQEFYGVTLEVTPDVLIPRPETEHLVEVALRWLRATQLAKPVVADVGCGSGAVAIALALEVPEATVWATDVSEAALAVAARNVARHRLADRVRLVHADVLHARSNAADLPQSFDVVLSNPPYVAAGERLPRTVADYEPHGALFAGQDGLDVVRRLIPEARARLREPGLLAIEHGAEQAAVSRALLLAQDFAGASVLRDLAGHDRVSLAWRGPDQHLTRPGFAPTDPRPASADPTDANPSSPTSEAQLDPQEHARD